MDPTQESAQKERLRASLARLMESGKGAQEVTPPSGKESKEAGAGARNGRATPEVATKAAAPTGHGKPAAKRKGKREAPDAAAVRKRLQQGSKEERAASRKKLEDLLARGSQGPGEPLDLSGQNLRRADLAGLDLSFANLSGADLSQADLTGTTLIRANLAGAVLYHATLDAAEFTGSDLAGANLEHVRARQTCFGMTTLEDASFFEADLTGSTLSKGNLQGADLRCTRLIDVRMREARLEEANLDHADLRRADLDDACVARASFDDADLRQARLRHLEGFESAHWIGADLRDVDFTGAYLLRRFVMDQNYIEEFRRRSGYHRCLYFAWWLTSDCGRSVARWTLFTLVTAFAFALAYTFTELDYRGGESLAAAFYYSVVTLTTLGYGDIVPVSSAARFLALTEVLVGYLMMGGLLSIFANKMARRAE